MELADQTARGFKWMSGFAVLNRALSAGSYVILGALLGPAEFGAFAVAAACRDFSVCFLDKAFRDILVSRHYSFDLLAPFVQRLLWLVGIILAISLVFIAPYLASALGQPIVEYLIYVVAALPLLRGLSVVPRSRLLVEMEFRYVALTESIGITTHLIGAIVMAFLGAGAWSLVVPLPAAAIVRAILFYIFSSRCQKEMRNEFIKKEENGIGGILKDAIPLASSALAVWGRLGGDKIALASVLGPISLGAYFFAFQLVNQPLHIICNNFQQVLLPALAKIEELGSRTAALNKALQVVGLIVIPMSLVQAAMVEPGLDLLFGDRWASAIRPLEFLSLGSCFVFANSFISAFNRASRRFRFELVMNIFSAILYISIVVLGGIVGGATGAAFAFVIGSSIFVPVYFFFSTRLVGSDVGMFIILLKAPIFLGLLCGLAAFSSRELVKVYTESSFLHLVSILIGSGVVYYFAVSKVAPVSWLEIYNRTPPALKKLLPGSKAMSHLSS